MKWLQCWTRWWTHVKWMWCHHVRDHPKQEIIPETNVVGCPTCLAMWSLYA